MRVAALTVSRIVLLCGATVLAFFGGGFNPEPQAWAGLVVWLLVVVAVLAQPQTVPRGRSAWVALGGLFLLGVWTLVSITWAPVASSAYHAGQLVMLYAGGLLAGTMLLQGWGAQRAVEPALAAGAVIVIGYGLSERLLPGLLHFSQSFTAEGRLEQPLTYWNAMGELAALGLVLCARLAGDASRPAVIRAIAAAASAPLGMGLYITFSRGALYACAAGLVVLIVAAPRREQLHALIVSVVAGALAAISASPFGGVKALTGAQATRERQGAIALALLAIIMLAAGLWQLRSARRERLAELRLPRRAPLIALVVICAGLAVAIVSGANEAGSHSAPSGSLATLEVRSAYWHVALRAFASEPLRGVGAGGWAVDWLRWRPLANSYAQDAHSLELQTLAELGVVGFVFLLAFFGGVALSARNAYMRAPVLAAGPIAGLVAYLAHSPLDWDWQMPAVTLVAIVLAGLVIAMAEPKLSPPPVR